MIFNFAEKIKKGLQFFFIFCFFAVILKEKAISYQSIKRGKGKTDIVKQKILYFLFAMKNKLSHRVNNLTSRVLDKTFLPQMLSYPQVHSLYQRNHLKNQHYLLHLQMNIYQKKVTMPFEQRYRGHP